MLYRTREEFSRRLYRSQGNRLRDSPDTICRTAPICSTAGATNIPGCETLCPFSEKGIGRAVADAIAMKTVKSTIVPWPKLVE